MGVTREEFERLLWAWVDSLGTCEGCPLAGSGRDDCDRGDCPLEAFARAELGWHR